jgi:hypothetical protein
VQGRIAANLSIAYIWFELSDLEGRWKLSEEVTKGSIISHLETYIHECEAEAKSDLIHRKNVELLADYLYKKDMKSILVFESIAVAVFLTMGLLLLGHIQSFQSTSGVYIGFILVVICMSLIILLPLINGLFRVSGMKLAVRVLQLVFFVLLFGLIGWVLPHAHRPILIFILYGAILGCTAVAMKAIGSFMLYFQPMAEFTGEIMVPKYFREAILHMENSPENGRLDTLDSLDSCMRYLGIPKQDMEQLLLKSKEHSHVNLEAYSEVPSIVLEAVRKDVSGDELLEMIQETKSKSVRKSDAFGCSFLECVINFTGNREYCKSLLLAGADPNTISSDFQGTMFHIAIQEGMLDLNLLEVFLEKVKDELDLWASPLWCFAKYKQNGVSVEEEREMAKALIRHGYDVNEVDFQSGESVLQSAARYKPYLGEVFGGNQACCTDADY